MGYAGMDISIYPGDDVMDDLIETTNLIWCGFYLGPAPSHKDPSWMDRRAHLQKTGWGFAPIYVGQQETSGPGSHVLTAKQGELDADNACFLAKAAGFGSRSVIYLDVEQGGALSTACAAYVKAWLEIVAAFDYVPGVYCSHTTAASVQALGVDVKLWVFKVATINTNTTKTQPFKDDDPHETGIADAVAWQWAQECAISTVRGPLYVDLDTAAVSDPSIV
ncbi:MAG: glycoside hydrolase domain-containing protein [Kofleriaceae bacterium]